MEEYEIVIKVFNHRYKRRLNAASRQDAQDIAVRQVISMINVEQVIKIEPEVVEDNMVLKLRNIFS